MGAFRRVLALFHRSRLNRDLDDELAFHLAMRQQDLHRDGVPAKDAVNASLRQFGGVLRVKEQSRDAWVFRWLERVLQDVRFAVRGFGRAPSFTAFVTLTLALGIGGTTAIFSAMYPVLLAPLPYPNAERVVSIIESSPDGARSDGTFAMYRHFVERTRLFDAIAVFRPWQPTITGTGHPERLVGQRISWGYFRVLGVRALAGRDFSELEDRFRGPNVVILSDEVWRRHFRADPSIVGRDITLDDNLFTVVGVMPPDFENVTSPTSVLWAPLQYDPTLPSMTGREWGHHLRTIGRIRADATVGQASTEVSGIGRTVISEVRPTTYDPSTQFTALPLQDELTAAVRPALLAIVVAVALVLVIACVNVTNLVLVRSVRRRSEFAMRAALGAGQARLASQLLIESVVLAALGGLAGLIIARLGVSTLVALSPPGLPRVGAIRVDAVTFGFCAGLTTLVGIAVGIIPAWQAIRNDPHRDLRHASHPGTARQRGAQRAMVVAQIALAVMLLVSSGLLFRSLERLLSVPIGFDAEGVLTMQVQIVGHRFDQTSAKFQFFSDALDAVRRVPGIVSAGLTSQLPLSGDRDEYGVQSEATPTQAAARSGAFRYAVSPGYLETLQIAVRAGRLLNEHDGPSAPRVAPFTVVGVVGDVKQASLAATDSYAVYMSTEQSWFADNPMSLVVRGRGDATALSWAIREAIWSIDKDQPVARIATMNDLLRTSAAERRFALLLFAAFALTSLMLAAAGIYSVMAGTVADRTREFGIRAAIGATRGAILNLVLGQGMVLTAAGLIVGLLGASALTRFLQRLLFGISPLDPWTFATVSLTFSIVAAFASYLPARRATQVDPLVALRCE